MGNELLLADTANGIALSATQGGRFRLVVPKDKPGARSVRILTLRLHSAVGLQGCGEFITNLYRSRSRHDCFPRTFGIPCTGGSAIAVLQAWMPLYEYECVGCERSFEYLLRSVDAQVACPFCAGEDVHRQISLCAVSSDSSRAANLSAAHQRAAGRRNEKQRSEHAHHHEHFGDSAKGAE